MKALAAEGAQKSAEIVTKSHLSLTGASGKVGLYFDKEGAQWYLPTGTAPSTHIVKQSHVRLDGIVTNERLCMMTAAKCGIEVPESFIIDPGSGADSEEVKAYVTSLGLDDKIIFTVNIYRAGQRHQHFGMIKNAFIRICDENGVEMCKYDLSENYDNMTAMVFGEMYRKDGAWKFNAIGQPTTDGDIPSLSARFK